MEKKSVCIIGGGVAGISAAHTLTKRGYNVTIYEKNKSLGGLFSGYEIDGQHIDICIHWLMGTKHNTKLNNLWKSLNGLYDDLPIYHFPYYLASDYKGTKLHLYSDLEKTYEEWSEHSPNDKEAIRKFCDSIKDLIVIWDYTQKNKAKSWDLFKILRDLSEVIDGAKMTREEYAERFQSDAIRFIIKYGLTGYNNTLFFMLAYAAFASGDSGLPAGGAEEMIKRATKTLVDEGVKIHYDTFVDEIVIENKSAVGIKIKDEFIKYDVVISALDPNYTLRKLLKGEYVSQFYSSQNLHMENNPISSCFVTYLSCDKKELNKIEVPTIIKIPTTKVGLKEIDGMLVRPYYYDSYFDKGDNNVVSLFFDQDQEDFKYYKSLDKKTYKEEVNKIAKRSEDLFLKKYPSLEGKCKILTYFGPIELYEYTKTSYGAILCYSFTKKNMIKVFKGRLPKVNNLYFCSQWNRTIGGSPCAILAGNKIGKLVDKPLIDFSKLKIRKSKKK